MTKSRKNQLKKSLKDNPYIDSELEESLTATAERADDLQALKAIADQRGGEVLADTLVNTVVSDINRLLANYHTLTHNQLTANLAHMSATLTVLHTLTRASSKLEAVDEELADALRE